MKVQSVSLARSAYDSTSFVRDGRPQIAFVGRSNVGKSSLLNRLAGTRKLARISSTPGRTRAVHYFLVNEALYLVDLPGYGFAKIDRETRDSWARLVDAYFESESGERSAVLLLDAKVGATPLDIDAYQFLADVVDHVHVVATKCDRVGRTHRAKKQRQIESSLALRSEDFFSFVSSRTGEGVEPLWRALTDRRGPEAR